jgi:putative membrane protein
MDWTAEQGAAGGFWSIVAIVGPAVCAALLLFLVVRALVRHSRYRVVGTFSDEDRRVVREAVAEAERKTVGEILPVIVERSDPHPGAAWMAALCFLLVGSTLLVTWLPWHQPLLLLLCQVGFGALGFVLAKALPDFGRVFVFEDRATEVAAEQAFQEFYANGLQKTEAATGVLVFVSLFERRVILLADEGIDSKVDADFWANTDELILERIRKGSLRDGLVAGSQAGDLLAEHFPWTEGDRNEIPDRVIVRHE